jgi:hypothetical protein
MQVKISSELKHLMKGAASAKDAWAALEKTFKAQSVGRKAVLRQMLKEIKRKKTEDVLVYVSRAEILRAELKDACDEVIPDDAFIYYILDIDGLGNAYYAFVRQYRYGNEVLSLQELKNRLLHVEMTVQQQDLCMGESGLGRAYKATFSRNRPPRPSEHRQHRTSDFWL